MSERLTKLRTAIEKLDEAEKALLVAREAYSNGERYIFDNSSDYKKIDAQFEVVGDARVIIEEVLNKAEEGALRFAQESARLFAVTTQDIP